MNLFPAIIGAAAAGIGMYALLGRKLPVTTPPRFVFSKTSMRFMPPTRYYILQSNTPMGVVGASNKKELAKLRKRRKRARAMMPENQYRAFRKLLARIEER